MHGWKNFTFWYKVGYKLYTIIPNKQNKSIDLFTCKHMDLFAS